MTNEETHRFAREKGVSRPLYALLRTVLTPLLRVWFRMHVSGRENVPATGAAIVAPNHKSFWDSFFIGIATRRHVRYMAKVELLKGRWGWLLMRLGAFPVRRGEADSEALGTARTILDQGGLLAIFPEGTRVRDPEQLGSPRRGAGRLALESGAPLVPCAITGTENLFLGPIPKPVRVQVTFGKPIPVAEIAADPDEAGALVERVLWPEVEAGFGRLRDRPGLIAAALTTLGLGAGGFAYGTRGRRRTGLARLNPRRSGGLRLSGRRTFRLPSSLRRSRSRLPWRR